LLLIGRTGTVDADALRTAAEAATRFRDGHHSPCWYHTQIAQPLCHHADSVMVDEPDLTQTKFPIGKLKAARFACLRKSSPMHPEAGGTIDLTQQPKIDLAESLHTPADALIVVNRI